MDRQKVIVSRVWEHAGHRDAVYVLAPGANAGAFLSCGADGLLVEWNAAQPADGQALALVPKPVYAMAALPANPLLLLLGQNDGGLHLYDLRGKRILRSAQAHADAIFDVLPMPGGQTALAASRDGRLSLWRVDGLRCVLAAQVGTPLRTVALSPDGSMLALGGGDAAIRTYSAQTLMPISHWTAHANTIFRLCFSPCGRWLLSGSRDARLKVWDARAGFGLHYEAVAHLFAINDIVFSPDGRHFATGSMDKTIKLWRASDFRLMKVVDRARNNSHRTGINRLLWLAEPNVLLSAADDRVVLQWRVDFANETWA